MRRSMIMAGFLEGWRTQLNLISGEDAIWKGGALPLSTMTAPYGNPNSAQMGVWTAFQGRYRV